VDNFTHEEDQDVSILSDYSWNLVGFRRGRDS